MGAANEPNRTRVSERVEATVPVLGSTENCTPGVGPRPFPLMVIISPGAIAPATPLAEFVTDETTTVEAAVLTVRVKRIVCGLFDAPDAVTVMVPVYVVGFKERGFTVTMRVAPEVDRLSHEALEAVVHESTPPPPLLMVMLCDGGVAPPTA